MALAASLLLGLAASACTPRVSPDLRWIGKLTPKDNPTACPPTTAVIILHDGHVTFTPDEGTWVLTGTATAAGAMEATRSRQTSGAKLYETSLEARWTESKVTGTYTTPRCTYAVALPKG